MTLERNHWWLSMTDEDKAKAMEREMDELIAGEAGCAHTASEETRERMEVLGDALTTPWRPPLCFCGHTIGDHQGGGGLSVRRGLCFIEGCDCRGFERKDEAA